jgi:hypothetical protein
LDLMNEGGRQQGAHVTRRQAGHGELDALEQSRVLALWIDTRNAYTAYFEGHNGRKAKEPCNLNSRADLTGRTVNFAAAA